MISLGSVRTGAKVIAQNAPETGTVGVSLLLTDPGDYDAAVLQALRVFDGDRPNERVVDSTTASGFRIILRGSGALAELTGLDAWPARAVPAAVWYPWDVASQGQEPLDPNSYRIVQDPGPKTVLEFLADTIVAGQTLRLAFRGKHTLTEAPNTVADPTTAPTVALSSPAVSGNVDNGVHAYVYTYVTAHGETGPSTAANVTVADNGTNGKVTIQVPASDDYGVESVNVYRTVAGGAGAKKLVGSVPDNGGTFIDNVADSSLGANAPSANTAGGSNSVDDDDEELITLLAASMVLQMAAIKAAQNTGNTNLPNDVVDRRTQSDIYRSRAKELRDLYNTQVGIGGGEVAAHSAFGDLDTEMSDGGPFLFHEGR